MNKNIHHFVIADCNAFKIKMLNWATRFNIFCFLDNNNYTGDENNFECLLAAGDKDSIALNNNSAFEDLKIFHEKNNGWLFGHMGYEINNAYPNQSENSGFNRGYFFSPQYLLRLTGTKLDIEISPTDPLLLFNLINTQPDILSGHDNTIDIQPEFTKDEYISVVSKILEHIKRGDCYELNFCQEFFSKNVMIDPLFIFNELQNVSPNPFSAFYKLNENYCMCASPERFLKKKGQVLISQPIKGTSKREKDPVSDQKNREYLQNSAKEKSENVMVVDLVRNDLSKICIEGSVHVKEIFGVYSFPQVHQMISTVIGILPYEMHWTKALAATFPMGSMTGAPKKRVMELIENYERSNRGLFSGSIGYITPDGDFDFNVVIRSIFYNKKTLYLSFRTGSGITFYSDPVAEYEECLIKAGAIMQVLQ